MFSLSMVLQNKQSNINVKELKALKLLAKNLFGYSRKELSIAVIAGELLEVNESG